MRQVIIAFFLFAFSTTAIAKSSRDTLKMLPDGHYYADVAYYNYANYVTADYNLKIKVRDGMVIVIYLINGGTVHYGINSEGYMYTGGKIDVTRNKHTGKLEYSAQVSISNGRSISSYTINILKGAPDE